MDLKEHRQKIEEEGFTIINDVFSTDEVEGILKKIDEADSEKPTFRKSDNLFAIRQFLKEIPEIQKSIFTEKLKKIIFELFGNDYFVTKSIYFDKPEQSNWFVAYHQDLTISVDKKLEIDGFGPWTTKQNQFAVQPSLDFLEDNFTIRIHLDNTNEENGALKIIPRSHLKGIYRAETIDWKTETEVSCNTEKGGIMIMKPLLLHASSRTTNNEKRRVIHIEFGNKELTNGLNYSERIDLQLV
ncbi:phytanoyl-CoA dioxygenase family protein [Frigoriflavimonas asaccharolytica]|uniref:Ectoine hydroxylase-related dioxygenase (Phytanoyl-CoA dioxygenase family) n=1 Tax=Frigoriflavimonas asaccharolytica TaxID=2735899 RepID=A0A8J8K8S4_9FLAO|nr:phytanoyl-CoA dioxygenase family protein [Frigoriflavimonas asaccharolytica]NRS92252.1 ectoine hydroxylase-related dioxygenase (phytanoyl-CoA dioxygenase family) [Frigoriflavimonas asaccharolytica]